MASVNRTATHKFVIVVNEKSPTGKLLSGVGQLAMSLYANASEKQRGDMSFLPFCDPTGKSLITVSTCSFVILKGTASQLIILYAKETEQGNLSAIFISKISFNGIDEDLIQKTAETPLDQTEPYAVGLFGKIEEVNPLTKKFSFFK